MASNDSDRELDDVESSEPLLISQADADAVIDAEQLRAHIASSKSARRWRRIRIAVGAVTVLVLFGIFIRLSMWRRPFDCKFTLPLHSLALASDWMARRRFLKISDLGV